MSQMGKGHECELQLSDTACHSCYSDIPLTLDKSHKSLILSKHGGITIAIIIERKETLELKKPSLPIHSLTAQRIKHLQSILRPH